MIDSLMLVLKGIAMGAADVVPGVSGGTIALLTGIYSRLINAITSFNIKSFKLLIKGQFKKLWNHVDGIFLLPLLIGIALAFIILSHSIKYSIEHHPVPTWSFFFGLIIASAVLIVKGIPEKKLKHYLWLLPGLLLGLWIALLNSIPFPSSQLAFFIAGMLAICAMILPGISGSLILLLLGMYYPLLNAVTSHQWSILMLFICGAIIGLIIFSRIIQWFLNRYYQISLFFLSGLMLGSLVKVWPWKVVSHNQELIENISPLQHEHSQLTLSIAMMIIAMVCVFSIDYFGKKITSNQ